MRHAEAALAPPGATDHERPLTEDGHSRTKTLGQRLVTFGRLPDQLLCSDAERAAQTGHYLLSGAQERRPMLMLPELYDCGPDELLETISLYADPLARHVLVIAHNPTIAMAAEHLAAGARGASSALRRFDPGSIAVFTVRATDWQQLRPNLVTLDKVCHPADYA